MFLSLGAVVIHHQGFPGLQYYALCPVRSPLNGLVIDLSQTATPLHTSSTLYIARSYT